MSTLKLDGGSNAKNTSFNGNSTQDDKKEPSINKFGDKNLISRGGKAAILKNKENASF